MKSIDIQALMHDHRVAMCQCKCQDRPKITLRKIGSGIVIVSIHVVDVPGERGELKNPWTSRGSHTSKSQWTGSIRIHFFLFQGEVFMTVIQMMSTRTVTVIGRLYSVQYKGNFGALDKVRRDTCEEARPLRLDFQREDVKIHHVIASTQDC